MKRILVLGLIVSRMTFSNHNYHNYLWANYSQFNEQYTQSLEHYQQLLHDNPTPFVYRGYLHLLQETNQWPKIAQLAEIINAHFKTDVSCQMILAQAYEQMGNQKACDEIIITLNETAKSHQELAFAASQIFLRRKEPENALKVINNFLNCSGDKTNNFIFYFVKSQIYVQLQKKDEALQAVKRSLELYPKFDKSWLLLALLEEQAGNMEKAAQGYSSFLQVTNDSKEVVEEHLSQLVVQYKLHNVLAQENPTNQFAQTQKLMQEKKFDQALVSIDSCLANENCNKQYRTAKIDILASLKKQTEAASLLKSWLMAQPEESAWYHALHLLGKHGLAQKDLVGILKEIEKKHPDNALPALYLADISLRNNSSEALDYLKKAARLSTDPAIQVKIQYQISLLHFQKRNFKELKKSLLTLYKQHPHFLPGLNMLAYYYASKEKNLAHAFMLIEQVLMQEPSNAHYQDTKAFILYKQGNYAQACSLLQDCVQKAPQDATIKRHLAKSLFMHGQKDQAKVVLQEALKLAYADEREKKKLTALTHRWNNGRNNKK